MRNSPWIVAVGLSAGTLTGTPVLAAQTEPVLFRDADTFAAAREIDFSNQRETGEHLRRTIIAEPGIRLTPLNSDIGYPSAVPGFEVLSGGAFDEAGRLFVGPRLGTFTDVTQFRFDNPIGRFGLGFAAPSPDLGVRFSFLDASGNILTEVEETRGQPEGLNGAGGFLGVELPAELGPITAVDVSLFRDTPTGRTGSTGQLDTLSYGPTSSAPQPTATVSRLSASELAADTHPLDFATVRTVQTDAVDPEAIRFDPSETYNTFLQPAEGVYLRADYSPTTSSNLTPSSTTPGGDLSPFIDGAHVQTDANRVLLFLSEPVTEIGLGFASLDRVRNGRIDSLRSATLELFDTNNLLLGAVSEENLSLLNGGAGGFLGARVAGGEVSVAVLSVTSLNHTILDLRLDNLFLNPTPAGINNPDSERPTAVPSPTAAASGLLLFFAATRRRRR